MSEIIVKSLKREEFIDITFDIENYLEEHNYKNGMLFLNTLHTTAALTINENADSDVKKDLLKALDALIPKIKFDHAEGNSDAHLKSSLLGVSLSIPVVNGKLVKGTWQGVYFCEFDGPRSRKIILNFMTN